MLTHLSNGSSIAKDESEKCHAAKGEVQRTDAPTVAQRFSYTNDPFMTPQKVSPEVTVVEMKPVGHRKKTIRDIRLRPRQTLCSNCKCAIHEGKKSRNAPLPEQKESVVGDENGRRLRTRSHENYSNALQNGQRKRKCPSSSPLVLLEDITHKSSKLNSFRDIKSNSGEYNLRYSLRHNNQDKAVNMDSSTGSFNKLSYRCKVSNSKPLPPGETSTPPHPISNGTEETSVSEWPKLRRSKSVTNDFDNKRTPAIKITIGNGNIVKIPPHLPETESLSTTDDQLVESKSTVDEFDESQIHRKSKKSGRKSRDKNRHRNHDTNRDGCGINDTTGGGKTQKKHKKKHRHRHASPNYSINIRESTSVPVSESYSVPVVENENCKDDSCSVETSSNVVLDSASMLTNSTKLVVPGVVETNSKLGEIREVKEKTKPTQSKIKVGDVFIDVVDISDSDDSDGETYNNSSVNRDENHENALPSYHHPIMRDQSRLLYAMKPDERLTEEVSIPQFPPEEPQCYLVKSSPSIMPLSNSPHRRKNSSPGRVVSASPNIHYSNSPSCLLKDYPLRSKTNGSLPGQPIDLLSLAEHNILHPSEDSQSRSSGLDSHLSDISEDSGEEPRLEDIFSNQDVLNPEQEDDKNGTIKPIMMKIQTQNVMGCLLEEGREIRVGDIVWGKIQGFPWWPGQVSAITITQRDNDVVITQLAKVAWFGSNTMSHVRCSDLFPFLEDFKSRYNKKKKGQYRQAIKQATIAAGRIQSTADLLDFAD